MTRHSCIQICALYHISRNQSTQRNFTWLYSLHASRCFKQDTLATKLQSRDRLSRLRVIPERRGLIGSSLASKRLEMEEERRRLV